MMILNSFLNLWIKQLKYLQENIDPAAIKKILSKDNQSKSPNFKSISSQITIFKQLKKKIMYKPLFLTQKYPFCARRFFFCQHYSNTVFCILEIWYPILFCSYLGSPIWHRKLIVLETKLWMSPFKWNMYQPSRMLVAGDIKQKAAAHFFWTLCI